MPWYGFSPWPVHTQPGKEVPMREHSHCDVAVGVRRETVAKTLPPPSLTLESSCSICSRNSTSSQMTERLGPPTSTPNHGRGNRPSQSGSHCSRVSCRRCGVKRCSASGVVTTLLPRTKSCSSAITKSKCRGEMRGSCTYTRKVRPAFIFLMSRPANWTRRPQTMSTSGHGGVSTSLPSAAMAARV